MDSKNAQDRHRKQVFVVANSVGLIVLVGYTIRNYLNGEVLATWIHSFMTLLTAGGLAGLLLGVESRKAYRVVLLGVGIGLLWLSAFTQNFLYFHLLMPLLYFFFLGRREGGILTGFFFLVVAVLLLAPGMAGTLVYDTEQGVRFLVGFVFVSIIAWGHESSSQRLYDHLWSNNQQLDRERKQLKRALERITETEARLEQTVTDLRDRSQLMETVFDNMDEGVVVSDADGNLLLFNPSAERILGLGLVDSNPEQWSALYGAFYPDRKTRVPTEELPLVRALQGETTDDLEFFVRNKEKPDGVFISVSGRPLQDETGLIEGGVIVLRDVTAQKSTDSELRQTVRHLEEQTHLMETVFNSISDGVIVVDENGEYLIFSPGARRIVGMRVRDADLSHRSEIYGIYYPDEKTLVPADRLPLTRAIHGESVDDVELFVRNHERPKGVNISVNGRPLQDESGVIKGGVITFRDVTEIKEAERRLKRTADDLRTQAHAMETIFNSISDGVVVADEQGNFTIFNPSAERIVGVGATESGPSQWTDRYGIFFPDRETTYPADELPLVRAIQGEPSDEVEMFIRNPNVPEGVYISVSGRPLQDHTGIAKGGVIVFRDVTERMRADEALSQAFAQGRLEIVDTIVHNIGNAINSVSTGMGTIHEQLAHNELVHRLSSLAEAIESHRDDWTGYLKSDPQGQKVLPFILGLSQDFAAQNELLTQTVERVEDRVTHIVDIIRTQRSLSTEALVRKDVDLRKAIGDALKLLQDSLARRDIEVRVECGNAPTEIRIQESRFHQMLVNLIKNAIEAIDDLQDSDGHAVKPIIQIQTYVEEEFLVIDVIDNGIGVEENRHRIIFAAGYTTKKSGSGLGLHSIANFVIGSGGEIYPVSAGNGEGTTMRVKLRLASVALKTSDSVEFPSLTSESAT